MKCLECAKQILMNIENDIDGPAFQEPIGSLEEFKDLVPKAACRLE